MDIDGTMRTRMKINNLGIQTRALCRGKEKKLINLWKRRYVELFIAFLLKRVHKLLGRNH